MCCDVSPKKIIPARHSSVSTPVTVGWKSITENLAAEHAEIVDRMKKCLDEAPAEDRDYKAGPPTYLFKKEDTGTFADR